MMRDRIAWFRNVSLKVWWLGFSEWWFDGAKVFGAVLLGVGFLVGVGFLIGNVLADPTPPTFDEAPRVVQTHDRTLYTGAMPWIQPEGHLVIEHYWEHGEFHVAQLFVAPPWTIEMRHEHPEED